MFQRAINLECAMAVEGEAAGMSRQLALCPDLAPCSRGTSLSVCACPVGCHRRCGFDLRLSCSCRRMARCLLLTSCEKLGDHADAISVSYAPLKNFWPGGRGRKRQMGPQLYRGLRRETDKGPPSHARRGGSTLPTQWGAPEGPESCLLSALA